jgi:hypothetical protein
LLPLVTVVLLIFGGSWQADVGLALRLVLSVILAVAILVSAAGFWRGSNRARLALLCLVALHYGLLAYGNAALALGENVPDAWLVLQLYDRALRATVLLVANVCCLLHPATVEYSGVIPLRIKDLGLRLFRREP